MGLWLLATEGFSGSFARLCFNTTIDYHQIMFEGTESWALVAIVLAFTLLGVVAVQAVMVSQQAEAAGCENGQAVGVAVNASKGRCFGH